MKKITLLLFFMLAIVAENYAQVNSYSFSQTSGTYTPLPTATVLATQTIAYGAVAGSLDDVNYTVALPFAFNFSGVNYAMGTNVYVNTNGFVSFGASAPTAGTYGPIGSTNVYDGAISAFGLDCNGGYAGVGNMTSGSPTITFTSGDTAQFSVGAPVGGTGVAAGATVVSVTATTVTLSANCTSTGTARTIHVGTGQISYQVLGAAPNQQLVIQFTKFRPYNATLRVMDYQIVLKETSNVVDIVYGSSVGSATSSTGQVGLRGLTNANFNNRNSTTSWASTTAGASNTASVTLSNTVLPASGLTFSWTPPPACTGTPTGGIVTPANLALCSGTLPGNLVASGYSTGVFGLTFQWEESTNGGGSYVNAVGGTGATTATYTPPAYAGTPIQYRLKVTCANSGLFAYSADCIIINPATPATQVTNLAIGSATLTSIPLNWVNGNGGRRVVYFSDSPVFVDPISGNAPALTATAAYSGAGQQIVYDGTGTTVSVTGLTTGNTYYAKVYEYLRCGAGPYDYYYNVSTGTNVLTVTTATVPVNNNLANAIPITCGSNYVGNTTYATLDEANATLQFGVDLDSPNVWYSFTGSGAAQTVTLNLCGSNYDTSVLVLTGTPGTLTAIAGNDDDAACAPNGTRSKVNFTSDGTTTYYIAIEGYNPTSVGTYTMDVTCAAVNPPAVSNQDCATSLAVNVDGSDTVSDNSYGNVSSAQPTCDLFGSIQDVWFSFVAPSSGAVDCLVINGTMTSSNFSVYSGSCAGLTEITGTCNSNLTAPTTESLTGLTVGNTYYVQVWSNAAEQGTFTLKLTDTALNTPSFDTANFMAYPNPVKDVLNLSYSKNISTVSVHNLLGQEVMSKNINAPQSKIDMTNLSSGTYLVKVTVDGLVKTVKIVKE